MVAWSYFEKFNEVTDKYLPDYGQGETMATQVCTAVCKLVYKWYNDGDVYDTNYYMTGWCNDLSSYANWLEKYTGCEYILEQIENCWGNDDYENILKELADKFLDLKVLEDLDKNPAVGDIYQCDGRYSFVDYADYYEGDEEEW